MRLTAYCAWLQEVPPQEVLFMSQALLWQLGLDVAEAIVSLVSTWEYVETTPQGVNMKNTIKLRNILIGSINKYGFCHFHETHNQPSTTREVAISSVISPCLTYILSSESTKHVGRYRGMCEIVKKGPWWTKMAANAVLGGRSRFYARCHVENDFFYFPCKRETCACVL